MRYIVGLPVHSRLMRFLRAESAEMSGGHVPNKIQAQPFTELNLLPLISLDAPQDISGLWLFISLLFESTGVPQSPPEYLLSVRCGREA
jgi:hypothetical protein